VKRVSHGPKASGPWKSGDGSQFIDGTGIRARNKGPLRAIPVFNHGHQPTSAYSPDSARRDGGHSIQGGRRRTRTRVGNDAPARSVVVFNEGLDRPRARSTNCPHIVGRDRRYGREGTGASQARSRDTTPLFAIPVFTRA